MGRHMMAWAALTLLVLLAGCHSAVTDGPLRARTGGGLDRGWQTTLPEGYDGWTVMTSKRCVLLFAWSTGLEEATATRALRCHDPESGKLRWEQIIPVPAGFVYDRIHLADDRVIYQNNHHMRGLDMDDGQEVWVFQASDPETGSGWVIGEALVAHDRVLISLSHDSIGVLDAQSGRWIRGIEAPSHRLIGAWDHKKHGLVALAVMVSNSLGQESQGKLVAIRTDVDGGERPGPPFAAQKRAWERDIETNTYDIHMIGDVLIGHLSRGELWGLRPENGEVLYKVPGTSNAVDFMDLSEIPDVIGPNELAMVSSRDFQRGKGPKKDHMVVLGQNQVVLTQGHRKGFAMSLLEVQAHNPRNFKPSWSVQLPSQEFFRFQQPLRDLGATLIAGGRFFVIVDVADGKVLWRRDADPEDQDWTSVSTNGRGLYVVYGRQAQPRLEAYPIR